MILVVRLCWGGGLLENHLLGESRVKVDGVEGVLRKHFALGFRAFLHVIEFMPIGLVEAVLMLLTVLAAFTLTKRGTGNPSLITLTVFLQTRTFLAITSFCMQSILRIHDLISRLGNKINLRFECIRVSL